MSYRKWRAAGIPGIEPAPLIGEKLGPIHMKWLKIKAELAKEMPLLTPDQLKEQIKQQKAPEDAIPDNPPVEVSPKAESKAEDQETEPDNTEEEDRKWAITGIVEGETLLSQFARLARRPDQLINIIKWKHSRQPFPLTAPRRKSRPVTIDTAQKHRDMTYLNEKFERVKNMGMELGSGKGHRRQEDSIGFFDFDNYDYLSERHSDCYRSRVISVANKINRSLANVLDRDDITFKRRLTEIILYDVRASKVVAHSKIIPTRFNEARIEYTDHDKDYKDEHFK